MVNLSKSALVEKSHVQGHRILLLQLLTITALFFLNNPHFSAAIRKSSNQYSKKLVERSAVFAASARSKYFQLCVQYAKVQHMHPLVGSDGLPSVRMTVLKQCAYYRKRQICITSCSCNSTCHVQK